MNYYRRYMADYLRDTAHLSMLEHGAYTLLLDHYYSAGKPLPANLEAIYRLCRAMTRLEQLAVRSVIEQYFPAGDDGRLHNLRADEELEKAKPAIEAARTNGVRGGRPKINPVGLAEEPTGGQPPTTNHHPLAVSHQEPTTTKEHGSRKNGAHHPSVDDSPVVQTLPLIDGSQFEVRQSLVAELEPLYPKVDIPATVNEMKGWLIGHKERRKTRRGIKAFITTWLHREQASAEAS